MKAQIRLDIIDREEGVPYGSFDAIYGTRHDEIWHQDHKDTFYLHDGSPVDFRWSEDDEYFQIFVNGNWHYAYSIDFDFI